MPYSGLTSSLRPRIQCPRSVAIRGRIVSAAGNSVANGYTCEFWMIRREWGFGRYRYEKKPSKVSIVFGCGRKVKGLFFMNLPVFAGVDTGAIEIHVVAGNLPILAGRPYLSGMGSAIGPYKDGPGVTAGTTG